MSSSCLKCGSDVEGMKFCGSCGSKVEVELKCSQCQNKLNPGAKFCGECGTPSGPSPAKVAAVIATANDQDVLSPNEIEVLPQVEKVAHDVEKLDSEEHLRKVVEEKPTESEVVPLTPQKKQEETTTTATPSPRPVQKTPPPTETRPISPSESRPVSGSEVRPTSNSEVLSPEGSRPVAGSVSSPTDGLTQKVVTSEEKKKFSVKASPKCAVCDKSVYETERAVDSAGLVFHKDCFRCKTCKAQLAGKQRREEASEVGQVKIATGQYLVAKEGSLLGKKGEFFCDKHTIKATDDVVKAKALDEKARDDNELSNVSALRKEANESARSSMQIRVGDMLPTCARCGQPIDKGQKAMTSGIQKMHESCPTKEESEKALRTTRYFMKKLPDRLAGTLTCDTVTKHPHTFLYELEKETLHEALRKNGNEKCTIRYLPDAQARMQANRKLVAPSSDSVRGFDLIFKDLWDFSFIDPRDNKPKPFLLVPAEQKLVVTKFHHANGVLQTMEGKFKYDESSRLCTAEFIDVTLEMWPPEAAAEMTSQLDPLAHLKAQIKGDPSPVKDASTSTPTTPSSESGKAHQEIASTPKKKSEPTKDETPKAPKEGNIQEMETPAATVAATATSPSPKKKGGCVIS